MGPADLVRRSREGAHFAGEEALWERKNGGRNVTFPARQYSVNGERRSFANRERGGPRPEPYLRAGRCIA